jgi:hypothetical protein
MPVVFTERGDNRFVKNGRGCAAPTVATSDVAGASSETMWLDRSRFQPQPRRPAHPIAAKRFAGAPLPDIHGACDLLMIALPSTLITVDLQRGSDLLDQLTGLVTTLGGVGRQRIGMVRLRADD